MTRLVLDTNVLLLFIVGNLVGKSRIRTTRRLEIYESNHLTILNNFASQFKKHVSTPNILTEASNLIGSGDQQLCDGGAQALEDYVKVLDEIYEPSKKLLSPPFFRSLGLADASLIHLAKKGDCVVTVDGQLYGMMVGHGIKVVNFLHHVAFTE